MYIYVHSLVYLQRPATGHLLAQINPVHIITASIFKICFNIILQAVRRSLKWSLLFSSFIKTLCGNRMFLLPATCVSHLVLLHLVTVTFLGNDHNLSLNISVLIPHLLQSTARFKSVFCLHIARI